MSYWPMMIQEAVRVGERILKGEPYEEMTIIPTVFVGRNQVKEYLNPDSPF